jgi:hypothetical protein
LVSGKRKRNLRSTAIIDGDMFMGAKEMWLLIVVLEVRARRSLVTLIDGTELPVTRHNYVDENIERLSILQHQTEFTCPK